MAGFVCIDSAIANTAIEYAAEMTASAKTELISTTLKNIYLRRQRAASRKIANGGRSTSNGSADFEDLGDFVAFWLTAFQNLFLIPRGNLNDESFHLFESGDDVCYIVEKIVGENGGLIPAVSVKRFTDISTTDNLQSVFSATIDWEETTYLNLLIHLCRFKLSCGILEKGRSSEKGKSHHKHRSSKLHLRKHFLVTTYASPFKHRMDKKSSRNVLSFPNVYFLIDDFESAWDNVTLSQGQEFCVELVVEIDPKFLQMYSRNASDANGSEHDSSNGTTPVSENLTTIFLGASSFSQIQEVFKKRQSSSNILSTVTTMFNKKQEAPTEFINMTGPNKVGKAQVAVSPLPNENMTTPETWGQLFEEFTDVAASSTTRIKEPPSLHCGITYVSVPCEHIMRMIFDSPREPSLLSAAMQPAT